MRTIWRRMGALLLAGALCMALLGGCSSGDQGAEQDGGDVGTTDSGEVQAFRAADMGMLSTENFNYAYLGMNLHLPESLAKRMDDREVMCLPAEGEHSESDQRVVDYAFLYWDKIPEENRETKFTNAEGQEWDDWFMALERVGTVGVFHEDVLDQLDVLTGGTEHTELGRSADGAYHYYLSIREGSDEAIAEELRQIVVEITEMLPLPTGIDADAFDEPRADISNLGEFTTQDISGETVTQDIFKGHKLTLVNLFTTWCSPCVNEIPELDQLNQDMAGKGVQVIGVVLDAADENGEPVADALEKAKLLQERTGAGYPFLLPDATQMNGRLEGISSVPETFFVDENGNIVGGGYVGARDLESWTEIVETELAALGGAS